MTRPQLCVYGFKLVLQLACADSSFELNCTFKELEEMDEVKECLDSLELDFNT